MTVACMALRRFDDTLTSLRAFHFQAGIREPKQSTFYFLSIPTPFLCLSVSLCVSLPLSVSLSDSLPLSVSLCVSLSLFVYLSLCVLFVFID